MRIINTLKILCGYNANSSYSSDVSCFLWVEEWKSICCHSSSCKEEQTVRSNSPKCHSFSSTITCGCFSVHLLLAALETSKWDCWHTLLSVHMCAANTPLPFYYQSHPSRMFLEQEMLQRNGDGHMSTPPWAQESRPPPWRDAAGIRCVASWNDYDATQEKERDCSSGWMCAYVFVWLAHAMRLPVPVSILVCFSWMFHIK